MSKRNTGKIECPACRRMVARVHNLTCCCNPCTKTMSLRQINSLARKNDQSHLLPVLGRFNVAERAIKRLQRRRRLKGRPNAGLAYANALDDEITDIVNDPRTIEKIPQSFGFIRG